MVVTETLEFHQNTLDTSIETFVKLIQNNNLYNSLDNYLKNFEDAIYLIIMKKLSDYLKTHENSHICDFPIGEVILQIKYKCLHFADNNPNFLTFKTIKLQELNIDTANQYINKILKVWFFTDVIIPIVDDQFS
jgi:hypothetical protein